MNREEARTIIDDCDKQIAPLLQKRFEAILAVKKYKEENGLMYRTPDREKEILDNLAQYGSAVVRVYKEIFNTAYDLQGIK
ncbi:chorismate mutase [Lachnospiraceae bacterium OttesenSCG-928-E19]|nr:chorismate mutase [Lachnospiraceae bacterium OttesenSCG-928-E19]